MVYLYILILLSVISPMQKLTDLATFTQKNSSGETWILFKHSFRCGISLSAFEELESAEKSAGCPEIFLLDVIADRPVSLAIADLLEITHQSPQVIYFYKGKPAWFTSHYKITSKSVLEAVKKMV